MSVPGDVIIGLIATVEALSAEVERLRARIENLESWRDYEFYGGWEQDE